MKEGGGLTFVTTFNKLYARNRVFVFAMNPNENSQNVRRGVRSLHHNKPLKLEHQQHTSRRSAEE